MDKRKKRRMLDARRRINAPEGGWEVVILTDRGMAMEAATTNRELPALTLY